MIYLSRYDNGLLFVSTDKHSIAELSSVHQIDGFSSPTFYFHRIKVRPENEGTGEGKMLMVEVCKWMDKLGGTIYNELNPYGKRDIESLKSFFRSSGFEDYNSDGLGVVMIRRPKG